MFKKRLFVILAIFVSLLFSNAILAQQQITPEKVALIQEYIEIIGVKSNIEYNVESKASDLFQSAISQSSGIREEQQAGLNETLARLNEKFKELFKQNVDLDTVIADVYYPLYDKHFTEDELRESINFLKTPLGKKVREVSSLIDDEAGQKIDETLFPKIQQLVNGAVEQDKEQLGPESTSLPEKQ